MALDSFQKQSSEKFVISCSFENDLDSNESIVLNNSTITAVDKDSNNSTSEVLTSGTITVDGSKLKIQVKDGDESKSPYKITFKAVTDATPPNSWEKDILMKIKEL